MTTQLPYQQPQTPAPPSAYPTAPPWANAAPAPADEPPPPPAPGAVTPWGTPYLQTGQLLVPYPEEMANAARPAAPRWWPVVLWSVLTLWLFSFGGIISAARRAEQARRGRNSVAPYWITWAATFAIGSVIAGVGAAVAVPAYLDYREDAITTQVESKIRTDGTLQKSTRVSATAVNCEPTGPRDVGGLRGYDCALTLADGRTGTLLVTADPDGVWAAAPRR